MFQRSNETCDLFETFEGTIGAFVGDMGDKGLYIHRPPKGWEYHSANSLAWNSYHQLMYNTHKCDLLTPKDLVRRSVPMPPVDSCAPSRMKWEDNFKSEIPFSELPSAVLDLFSKADETRLFVVLDEDRYETNFGDGKYLYPKAVLLDEKTAALWIEDHKAHMEAQLMLAPACTSHIEAELNWCEWTIKEITAVPDRASGKVLFKFSRSYCETYSVENVIKMLDRDLLLDRVRAFMRAAHAGRTRKHGAPYAGHPEAVMRILRDEVWPFPPSPTTLVIALLHDVLEDSPVTRGRIAAEFGEKVAAGVETLTRRKGEPFSEYAARLKAAPADIRLIKSADRLHNLREAPLSRDPDFMREYAVETKVSVLPLVEDGRLRHCIFEQVRRLE